MSSNGYFAFNYKPSYTVLESNTFPLKNNDHIIAPFGAYIDASTDSSSVTYGSQCDPDWGISEFIRNFTGNKLFTGKMAIFAQWNKVPRQASMASVQLLWVFHTIYLTVNTECGDKHFPGHLDH